MNEGKKQDHKRLIGIPFGIDVALSEEAKRRFTTVTQVVKDILLDWVEANQKKKEKG